MDKKSSLIDEIPQAVQSHLTILQSIIQRMSSNCTSCKTWCITLVSGLLVVLLSNTSNSSHSSIFPVIIAPILLFFTLDSYYLALEKRFREAYNNFIEKMHNDSLMVSDLFVINPSGNLLRSFFEAMRSVSVFPFYLTLFLLNLFVCFYVI